MALDKLIDSTQLDGAMESTADAIRAKTGNPALLTWDMNTGFESAIGNILTPADGSIPTLASTDVTVSGKTVTIPVGKYTGASSATGVTKSIGVGTITSGTASITSLTKTYNATSGKFDITGSANVSAPTVGTAGYVSSSEGTKNAKSGGATVSATIDKIVGSTNITGATTKKPSITKQDVPSGVTQAASGNATTTAPSSGVYVAVKSSENLGIFRATPSVTTAGYGTADYHGIVGNTQTVGALASDITYVPITTTTATVSGKTVSYGSGWITEGSKSVADGAYDVDVISHSVTQPIVTGAINGTVNNIATTSKPTGTDGTDYWTITPKGSNTSTGFSIAKGKATITTAGYIASGSKETSESSVNITSTVRAGTERYIVKGTATHITYGGTSSGTINRGNQIKIGAGYYPSDLYYTAQANSGTLNITASGTTSCNGYAHVFVPKTAIIVEVTATSNTTTTISNSDITTNHYVYNTTSTVPLSDISWTTSDGSLTLTCSNGIPAMYVLLCRNM